ncbi:GNAT family N-acetyltransferase [Nocardioides sp. 503]|uniref:GNAT family N-acetyltransferase n=1 Tax=Nocardioides sp. 503 TaxID=2508326 RepID=UPI001FD646F7|nr:GNAT family N-acetyltransferase [Nocardioides sp. 503]
MSRSLVSLRCAELSDAPVLAELWCDGLRRADPHEQVADLELVIKGATASPEQRMLVAEYDGALAGAILLRVATLSAINLEQIVQAVSPHVFPQYRRHGIGRALMESAVAFAEELGIAHVATAATSGSRDANRFMARLALGPYATLRLAPTVAVRGKLTAQRPVLPGNGRQRTRLLAARRSMRRAQVETPELELG